LRQNDTINVTLPLREIRVLDLTRVLAGPLCTMLLGDLGADVAKVERPGRGDDTRDWGPPFDERGESAYYVSVNRNKYSVAADFSSEVDRKVITTLLSGADVVVENFLPGTLERFALGADEMLQRHSDLIWCTITGFGADNRRPGYDFVIQAESGWMAITGEPDRDPMKSGIALADLVAGKDAAIAILAALVGRSRGRAINRHIVISLAESARAALVNVAQNALVSRTEARRWGNAHANLVPYELFQTRDRPIVIAVGNDDQWRACVRVLGLDELASDQAIASNPGRLAQRQRIVRAFQAALSRRTASEWLTALGGAAVPSGAVKTVLEAIQDAAGASPLTGMPSSVGGKMRLPPPRLDEHGARIRELGWAAFPE
jgi:crotonobetainyl-CoA:carnitine CoA-transferase CaiB-like acyl-CoA transferase